MTREKAVLFGEARTLTGIVTEPLSSGGVRAVGFVFLNAGVVHRVGPNRIHVTAARRLAAGGFLSVRFDLSGLGDSDARRDTLPFDQAAVLETREVLSWVQREHGISRFVLAGLCSGAVVAFRTALADERVAGVVLINPQGFDHSTAWNTFVTNRTLARQYWRKKLFRLESWRRALSGRSDYRRLLQVLGGHAAARFRQPKQVSQVASSLAAGFDRLQRRQVRLLVACSRGDFGVDYLNVILGGDYRRLGSDCRTTMTLPAGDHSLTMAASQDAFFDGLERWAGQLSADMIPPVAVAAGTAVEVPAVAAARGQLS